jgi:hypothetical protein
MKSVCGAIAFAAQTTIGTTVPASYSRHDVESHRGLPVVRSRFDRAAGRIHGWEFPSATATSQNRGAPSRPIKRRSNIVPGDGSKVGGKRVRKVLDNIRTFTYSNSISSRIYAPAMAAAPFLRGPQYNRARHLKCRRDLVVSTSFHVPRPILKGFYCRAAGRLMPWITRCRPNRLRSRPRSLQTNAIGYRPCSWTGRTVAPAES